ncbi:MAG: hypothetical protein ABI634_09215 [Acidobacteriota bacterium]
MTQPVAIQLAPPDAERARLRSLELDLAAREADLAALKNELHGLQSRYLREIGDFYAQLSALEAAVDEAEIRAGLRPAFEADEEPGEEASSSEADAHSCSNRGAPSDDLKRVFRDLAKAIHPDLAEDEPARCRRHSLMAEANRAYAERDEDRLRLIMRAWERSPETVLDDDPEAGRARVQRRIADIDARLVMIEAELSDLRASAIWRLKGRIDEARAQGWDLFAEMILQVKREIARATVRLQKLRAGV